jgi:hypothetical protein
MSIRALYLEILKFFEKEYYRCGSGVDSAFARFRDLFD